MCYQQIQFRTYDVQDLLGGVRPLEVDTERLNGERGGVRVKTTLRVREGLHEERFDDERGNNSAVLREDLLSEELSRATSVSLESQEHRKIAYVGLVVHSSDKLG